MAVYLSDKPRTKLGKQFDEMDKRVDAVLARPKQHKNISTAKTRAGKAPIISRDKKKKNRSKSTAMNKR